MVKNQPKSPPKKSKKKDQVFGTENRKTMRNLAGASKRRNIPLKAANQHSGDSFMKLCTETFTDHASNVIRGHAKDAYEGKLASHDGRRENDP
jgi:hypothetical protein